MHAADSLWDGLKSSFPLLDNLLVDLFWRTLCGRGRGKQSIDKLIKWVVFFWRNAIALDFKRYLKGEGISRTHRGPETIQCKVKKKKKNQHLFLP